VSDENFKNIHWLIDAIVQGVRKRGGEGTAHTLARLAQQDTGAAQFREPVPHRQPVCRYLAQCIAETMLLDANLAAALAAVEDRLNWRLSVGYSDALLGEGFMASYGWCEIVGANGFFPGEDFRLGLLLLGPGLHYKDHYHPAPELYWPLTGPSDWKRGAGGFETRNAGDIIWHKPFVMHATRTLDTPLLAVWSWTEDTATPAKLAGQ
jgi:hypothetical protein